MPEESVSIRSDVAGIILAGGRSSRMGSNKALLALPGESTLTFVERLTSFTLWPLRGSLPCRA